VAHLDQRAIPPLLTGLIDDAAVFPPGNATLPDALAGHQRYRGSWYRDLVGPLLLPASSIHQLPTTGAPLRIGVIADTGIEAVSTVLADLPGHVEAVQVEARAGDAAAMDRLLTHAPDWGIPVFAEIPVVTGLDSNLARLSSAAVTPKFRTGGESPQLFPTPRELATAITGCAEAGTSFKLTAGLHRAVRHTDPATGFTHHGFGNVLAAVLAAANDKSVVLVTDILEITESRTVGDHIRDMLAHPRPLWAGYGSCSIAEPLEDLIGLSLIHEEI
jgi:hypothetical protein